MTARLQWLAGPDGTAHASGRGWDTLCGRRAVLERLAWPALRRCRVCEERAKVPA